MVLGRPQMTERRVKCSNVSVHPGLRRGAVYTVIREERGMYVIKDSSSRKRKYSAGCFVDADIELVDLKGWTTVDDCKPGDLFCEVELEFSNGSRRLMDFVTLEHLETLLECPDFVELRSCVLVKAISRELIEKTLRYLEARDDLNCNSSVLEYDDEDE